MSTNTQYKSDVTIIGGGVAGLAAALELLDLGKSVVILDRDKAERFGGLAKKSFGGMFMVGTPHQKKMGIKDSPDLAFQDWKSFAEFDEEDVLPRKWAEAYVHRSLPDVYNWLQAQSVKFFPVVHWVERGLQQPGNSVPRFHMVWGTGKGLTDALIGKIVNHKNAANFQVVFDHHVQGLLTEGGAVIGCRGTNTATNTDFEAKSESVIVAAGGINGNIPRVKANWPKRFGTPPEVILNGAHDYGDGEMHDRVSDLGGRVTHLDRMWNYAAGVHHPFPEREGDGLSLVPTKSALWMNALGERIGPTPLVTAFDTSFLVEEICKQPGQYSWQVLNQKIALKELAVSGSEFNDAIRDKKLLKFLLTILTGNKKLVNTLEKDCVDFVTANNLPELTAKMNNISYEGYQVNGQKLEAEIKKYDDMIDRGQKFHNDDQLRRIAQLRQYRGDKVRTCKFQKILDPSAMPLIAIRLHILSRKSLGGIQTDLDSRVLDNSGQVIPGLYAAGESAGFGGGGSHGHRALEGTFLGGCVLTGRVAAQSIAGSKTAPKPKVAAMSK